MFGSKTNLVETCRALYPAAERFWTEIDFQPEFGFKILNGPPIRNAEFLFIGYQPGGGTKDWEKERAKGTHKSWPSTCEYWTEDWLLAKRLRRIFSEETLKNCVGTNAIFLRYKNDKDYRAGVGTKRDVIELFCRESVAKIVETIQPKRIVTIGFRTLEMFGESKIELAGKKRSLIKRGSVFGRNTLGLIHLTGARPSTLELDALADYFKQR